MTLELPKMPDFSRPTKFFVSGNLSGLREAAKQVEAVSPAWQFVEEDSDASEFISKDPSVKQAVIDWNRLLRDRFKSGTLVATVDYDPEDGSPSLLLRLETGLRYSEASKVVRTIFSEFRTDAMRSALGRVVVLPRSSSK